MVTFLQSHMMGRQLYLDYIQELQTIILAPASLITVDLLQTS